MTQMEQKESVTKQTNTQKILEDVKKKQMEI